MIHPAGNAEDHRIDDYWGASLARPRKSSDPDVTDIASLTRPVLVDEQLTEDDFAIIREEEES